MATFSFMLLLLMLERHKADRNLANDRYRDADNIRSSELGLNRNYERNDHGTQYGNGYGQGRGYGGGYGGGGGPSRRNPYGRNGDSDGRYSVYGVDPTSGHGINAGHGVEYSPGYGRNRAEMASHAHADAHADAAAHAYGYGDDVRHGYADEHGHIGSYGHADGRGISHDGVHGRGGRYGYGGAAGYGYGHGRGDGAYGYGHGRGDGAYGYGHGGESRYGYGHGGDSAYGGSYGRGGSGTSHRGQGAFKGAGSYGNSNVYGNGYGNRRFGMYSPTYGKGSKNNIISPDTKALKQGEIDDEIANLANRAARGDTNAKKSLWKIKNGSLPVKAAIQASRNEDLRNATNHDMTALAAAGVDPATLLKLKAQEHLNRDNTANLSHLQFKAAGGDDVAKHALDDLKSDIEEAEGTLAGDPAAIAHFAARVQAEEHDASDKPINTLSDANNLQNAEDVKKIAHHAKVQAHKHGAPIVDLASDPINYEEHHFGLKTPDTAATEMEHYIKSGVPTTAEEADLYKAAAEEGALHGSKPVYPSEFMAAMHPDDRQTAMNINAKNAASKALGAKKAADDAAADAAEHAALNQEAKNIAAMAAAADEAEVMAAMTPAQRAVYQAKNAVEAEAAEAALENKAVEQEAAAMEAAEKKALQDLEDTANDAKEALNYTYPLAAHALETGDDEALNVMALRDPDLAHAVAVTQAAAENAAAAKSAAASAAASRAAGHAADAEEAASMAVAARKPSLARAYANAAKAQEAKAIAAAAMAKGDLPAAAAAETQAAAYEAAQQVQNQIAGEAERKARARLDKVNNAVEEAAGDALTHALAAAKKEEDHDNAVEQAEAEEGAEQAAQQVAQAAQQAQQASAEQAAQEAMERLAAAEEQAVADAYAAKNIPALGHEMARQELMAEEVAQLSGKPLSKDDIAAMKAQRAAERHAQRKKARAHDNHHHVSSSHESPEPSLHHVMNAGDFLKENQKRKAQKERAEKKAKAKAAAQAMEESAAKQVAAAGLDPLHLSPTSNVKAAEEQEAAKQEADEVKAAQKIAIGNVAALGGTPEEALQAGVATAAKKRAQIEQDKAARIAANGSLFANQLPPALAAEEARHHAVAHSGRNPTAAKTQPNKEDDDEEALEEAKAAAVNMIKDSASSVPLEGASIDLPFSRAPAVKAQTPEDEKKKAKQAKLRDALRNKFTNRKFVSGLPIIHDKKGYLNVPESANSIHIDSGHVYYTQQAYDEMKAKKMDVSPLKPKLGGEDGALKDQAAYYEAGISDMTMELPTPHNMNPPKVLKNGKEQLDISQASKIEIANGQLNMQPWSEYSKLVHPKVYQQTSMAAEAVAADELKKFAKKERKNQNLLNSEVELVAGSDGATLAQVTPTYGVITHDSAEEAAAQLDKAKKGISPDDSDDEPLNINADETGSDAMEEFVATLQSSGALKNDLINPVNPVNNTVDESLTYLAKSEGFGASPRGSGSPADTLFNNLLVHSQSLGKNLKIPPTEFAQRLDQLTPAAFNSLLIFYSNLPDNTEFAQSLSKIDSQPFSYEIKNAFPNHSVSEVYLAFSGAMRNMTGLPNMAKDKIISVVPVNHPSIAPNEIPSPSTAIVKHMAAKSQAHQLGPSPSPTNNENHNTIMDTTQSQIHPYEKPVENTHLQDGSILQTIVSGTLPANNDGAGTSQILSVKVGQPTQPFSMNPAPATANPNIANTTSIGLNPNVANTTSIGPNPNVANTTSIGPNPNVANTTSVGTNLNISIQQPNQLEGTPFNPAPYIRDYGPAPTKPIITTNVQEPQSNPQSVQLEGTPFNPAPYVRDYGPAPTKPIITTNIQESQANPQNVQLEGSPFNSSPYVRDYGPAPTKPIITTNVPETYERNPGISYSQGTYTPNTNTIIYGPSNYVTEPSQTITSTSTARS